MEIARTAADVQIVNVGAKRQRINRNIDAVGPGLGEIRPAPLLEVRLIGQQARSFSPAENPIPIATSPRPGDIVSK